MNKTSKYKRVYGKGLKELAIDLGVSMVTAALMHKRGTIAHMQLNDPSIWFKALDRRILSLIGNINNRCNNPRDKKYKYYGGKGIRNFLTIRDVVFLWDRDEASKLNKPSIDRIDSDGNYDLSNCRFIEWEENNRRTFV